MRKQTKLWTTKDGRRIRICDMSNQHLINTINMLERFAKVTEQYLISSGYSTLSGIHGEAAEWCLENELMNLEEYGLDPSEICDLYDNLVEERMRREDLNARFQSQEITQTGIR